ncbi:hypothetical protein CY35_10G083500 [Sphagnum magellanicum]|nr:hypothetical protein CY35_10G083500 [Sphagnum magellanicum]
MDSRGAYPQRPLSGKQLEHLLQALDRAIDIVLETKKAGDLQAQEEPNFKKLKAGAKERRIKGLKENLIVGINNVTRALEKLPSDAANTFNTNLQLKVVQNIDAGLQDLELKVTQLQVVLVAIDVNPRTLINHVMLLCTSRGVPILPVSGGDGCGSLRLGELLGTRTAIAIGIKDYSMQEWGSPGQLVTENDEGDTPINWALQSILETRAR